MNSSIPWHGKIVALTSSIIAIVILAMFTANIWFSSFAMLFIFVLASNVLERKD